jgi:hypothetical protein
VACSFALVCAVASVRRWRQHDRAHEHDEDWFDRHHDHHQHDEHEHGRDGRSGDVEAAAAVSAANNRQSRIGACFTHYLDATPSRTPSPQSPSIQLIYGIIFILMLINSLIN